MEKLKVIFKRIREDFKEYVPPLTAVIDQEHHYEVWAENEGTRTFFGKIILNKTSAEIFFYPRISKETQWTLYPGDIFKRTEDKFECQITDLSPELESDIKEVIGNMVDYFRMNKLLPPEPVY